MSGKRLKTTFLNVLFKDLKSITILAFGAQSFYQIKFFKKEKTMKTLFVLSLLSAFSTTAAAGNLNPPGSPEGTMKTLDEVEPRIPIPASDTPTETFTISQSGSYYLTGDRQCSGTGIRIDADDVTIDLMGYTLKGPDSGTNYGIYMVGRSNVEIRNGTVRDFYDGILESSNQSKGHRVICVRSVSNGLNGIYLGGSNSLIKDCMVSNNGIAAGTDQYSIYAGIGSTVTGNVACNNGKTAVNGYVHGIWAGMGSTVTGNTSYGNGEGANNVVYGIYASGGCTVTGNTACNNGYWNKGGVYGIHVDNGCTVIGNTAYFNGNGSSGGYGWGIHLGGSNLVDQNTAYNNHELNPNIINMNNPGNCTFGTNHAP